MRSKTRQNIHTTCVVKLVLMYALELWIILPLRRNRQIFLFSTHTYVFCYIPLLLFIHPSFNFMKAAWRIYINFTYILLHVIRNDKSWPWFWLWAHLSSMVFVLSRLLTNYRRSSLSSRSCGSRFRWQTWLRGNLQVSYYSKFFCLKKKGVANIVLGITSLCHKKYI